MAAQDKKSIYSPEVYKECLDRIAALNPGSRPAWGKMDVSQMLAHCSEVIEVLCGKDLKNTPFVVKMFKGIVRRAVVSDHPYPKNTKTHPQYVQHKHLDFEQSKRRLLKALERLHTEPEDKALSTIHPLFGRMNLEERGWSAYKHLNHHLTQFGV